MILAKKDGSVIIESTGSGITVITNGKTYFDSRENGIVKSRLICDRNILDDETGLDGSNDFIFQGGPPISRSLDGIAVFRKRLADLQKTNHHCADVIELIGQYRNLIRRMKLKNR